jgi:CxxC-x17-CxxC domain-containing protein
MGYQDKQLTCVDCGSGFVFTAGEQEHHAKLGFTNEPKRCPPCRAAKKARGGGGGGGGGGFRGGGGGGRGGGGGPREMFPAVCGECGKQTEVPFKPRGDRPVYCSDCFSKRR